MADANTPGTGDGACKAEPPKLSACAVTGLVLGIIALLGSWMPILNNIAFFIGLLALVFSVIGVVAGFRRTRRGKGLAIAALIVSIVSIAVVLGTQSLYSDAIDEATSGAEVESVSASEGDEQDAEEAENTEDAAEDETEEADYSSLSVGTSVELDDGLVISVDSVETGLVNYDDSEVTCVTVTYTNNGSSEVSFNEYDWMAQDAQGAQDYTTYYDGAEDELSSGTLVAGGTKTGNIYFDGTPSKVVYYSNMFDESTVGWVIE